MVAAGILGAAPLAAAVPTGGLITAEQFRQAVSLRLAEMPSSAIDPSVARLRQELGRDAMDLSTAQVIERALGQPVLSQEFARIVGPEHVAMLEEFGREYEAVPAQALSAARVQPRLEGLFAGIRGWRKEPIDAVNAAAGGPAPMMSGPRLAPAAPPIVYVDRATGRLETEAVYGGAGLRLLYGPRAKGAWLLPLVIRPVVSWLYGKVQDMRWSGRKIRPFIEKYRLDASEFLDPVESFATFNQFFTRKLKPEARPVAPGKDVAVLPADARYLFFPRIDLADGFVVKGRKFTLASFLGDKALAARYEKGSMVIARLCPTDYHRFHFPAAGVAAGPKLINGVLYSVNPVALRERIDIFTQNKRVLSTLESPEFGRIVSVEVGATMVGRITQTYSPGEPVAKGQEKGFFSFGGSTVVLLFEPGRIVFDEDLLAASRPGLEILCRAGQSLGRALPPATH